MNLISLKTLKQLIAEKEALATQVEANVTKQDIVTYYDESHRPVLIYTNNNKKIQNDKEWCSRGNKSTQAHPSVL